MSSYDQNHPQVSYPPQAMPPSDAAAPPAGYPTTLNLDGDNKTAATTQTRGDGFWKGCCAALCCCCVLDACF